MMDIKYTRHKSGGSRFSAVLSSAALFAAAQMLASCSEDSAPDYNGAADTPQIVVSAAGSDATVTTRAADPAIPDPKVCSADMMIITSYTALGASVTPNKLSFYSDVTKTDLTRKELNKVTDYSFYWDSDKAFRHTFTLRALAFRSSDYNEGLFTYYHGDNLTQSYLRLNPADASNAGSGEETETMQQAEAQTAYHVPELFYAPLQMVRDKGSLPGLDTEKHYDSEHFSYDFYKAVSSSSNVNDGCKGTLYRIVGQINITLTEVPESFTKAELLCSNLPVGLPLYSSNANRHSDNYPIAIADATTSDGTSDVWTIVDEKYWGSTLKLSTFMLPNDTGCELKLRLTDKSGKVSRYDIRPGNSVFLQDTDNIYRNVSNALKAGAGQYYIYSNLTLRYYAYANVRVNIRAKFDKVADNPIVVVTGIEVEPAFETKHNFNITQ